MANEIKLPELGESVEAGTAVAILVSEGDTVEEGQALIEVETDKASVEVPAPSAGKITKILISEGDEVSVGQGIVEMEGGSGGESSTKEDDGAEKETENKQREEKATQKESKDAEEKSEPQASSSNGSSSPSASTSSNGHHSDAGLIPAAPSVRRLARELKVDLHDVSGSGPNGRITADDVHNKAGTSGGATAATGLQSTGGRVTGAVFSTFDNASMYPDDERREALSGVRKAISRNMSTAWQGIPHVTNFDEADITEIDNLRRKLQPKFEKQGAKVTVTAILLKVVVQALRQFPQFNASLDTDNNEVIYKRYYNMGVAVDTDRGLLVPVVKDIDKLSLVEVAQVLGDISKRARDKKLSPDEMRGATFTVTNLGGIGGTGFTPIINPPEVAILGVSRSEMQPKWNAEAGQFEPRLTMPIFVSYDHRLIDGADAAKFLRFLCRALEEPFFLALEG